MDEKKKKEGQINKGRHDRQVAEKGLKFDSENVKPREV